VNGGTSDGKPGVSDSGAALADGVGAGPYAEAELSQNAEVGWGASKGSAAVAGSVGSASAGAAVSAPSAEESAVAGCGVSRDGANCGSTAGAELSHKNACEFSSLYCGCVDRLRGSALSSTRSSSISGNGDPWKAFPEEAPAPANAEDGKRAAYESAAGGAKECTPSELQIAVQTAPLRFQRVSEERRGNPLSRSASAAMDCRDSCLASPLSSARILIV
jgi:hypothetical protein